RTECCGGPRSAHAGAGGDPPGRSATPPHRRAGMPSSSAAPVVLAAVLLSTLGVTADSPLPRPAAAPLDGVEARTPAVYAQSPHSFYFTRAEYSSRGYGGWGRSWSTDYPKADRQFLVVLRRLARLDA